ncbi:hypothetical protein EVAR_65781_1 [Eumeta japonica]|uniref:Uncharacterized protein n=1 Tax=Eumeta variegata TaxID=151549 RepID=A0A4C2A5X1_EUMVA|nr:hypothetical protein EVAR_65781_1 [Eumeta japonica]
MKRDRHTANGKSEIDHKVSTRFLSPHCRGRVSGDLINWATVWAARRTSLAPSHELCHRFRRHRANSSVRQVENSSVSRPCLGSNAPPPV